MTQKNIVSPRLGTLLGAALISSGYGASSTEKGTVYSKGDRHVGSVDVGWTKCSGAEGDITAKSAMVKDIDDKTFAIADNEDGPVTLFSHSNFAVAAAQKLRLMGFTVTAPRRSPANARA